MQQPSNVQLKASHHTTWWGAAIPMRNVKNDKRFSIKHALGACRSMSASVTNMILCVLDCFDEIQLYLYFLCTFPILDGVCCLKLSPWRTMARLSIKAKTTSSGGLARQGIKVSAARTINKFSRKIPSNYIHYEVWDESWEWISNFIPHFTGYVITYPFWD